jgi:hypothetical protein
MQPIFQSMHPLRFGAMVAAKHQSFDFKAMSDDAAVTVLAVWREGVNGAFETVEDVSLSSHNDFKRLVVLVSADFALAHFETPSLHWLMMAGM